MTTPPRTVYRADHPGSFIRPAALRKARVDRAQGRISDEALRHIEDEAILDVLALQREVGLDIASDGEFRRKFFMTGPYAALEGVEDIATPDFERFPRLRDVDPEVLPEVTRPSAVVVGPLRLKRRITGDEVAFLKQHAEPAVQDHHSQPHHACDPRRLVQARRQRRVLSFDGSGVGGARGPVGRRGAGTGE